MIEENKAKVEMIGHVLITDKSTQEVILDEHNAINFEAMSYALALSLGNQNVSGVFIGPIEYMVFGNGGTSVSSVGVITYLDSNVTGLNASLYNQTYQKIVDQNNPQNTDTSNNFMTVAHTSGNLFSDLIVTCTLEFGEPAGQLALDNDSSYNDTYVFDELGLVNYNGNLITYVNFSPVQKSSNRIFEIVYTLRIALV
jgi:hypothetical protein